MSTDTLNLLEALKADMAEEERVLQSYPRLREFCMSSEEVDYVRAIRAATEREILSEAKEKSIFFALFPTHKFKYATSVVIGAGPSATPVEMQLHSGETALPLSEALDPLGGLQRREALWKGTGQ